MLKKNFKYLLTAVGIVLVWRGVWGLADLYLMPSFPIGSFGVSILIGIFILLFVNYRDRDIREIL